MQNILKAILVKGSLTITLKGSKTARFTGLWTRQDKGTAELTVHLIPTWNLIRNSDAKGSATHKQRSLATQGCSGEPESARVSVRPTNLCLSTFSPLLLSYLIWAEPCKGVTGLRLWQPRLNKLFHRVPLYGVAWEQSKGTWGYQSGPNEGSCWQLLRLITLIAWC